MLARVAESEQGTDIATRRSAPRTLVAELQRTIGNRALAQVLQRKGYQYATESEHYSDNRDDEHRRAKAALLAADGKGAISKKIYAKHNAKNHGGKVVTTFPRTGGGWVVVVTYADLAKGRLTYDTAYVTMRAPGAAEKGAVTFSPTAPVLTV